MDRDVAVSRAKVRADFVREYGEDAARDHDRGLQALDIQSAAMDLCCDATSTRANVWAVSAAFSAGHAYGAGSAVQLGHAAATLWRAREYHVRVST